MSAQRRDRTVMIRVTCPADMTHAQAKREVKELIDRHSWTIATVPDQQLPPRPWTSITRVWGGRRP